MMVSTCSRRRNPIFNRDFVIDHGVSMELRSSEFLGQSNTYNLCFQNIAFTFRKYTLLISVMTFRSIAPMHLSECVIQCRISPTLPPQNAYRGPLMVFIKESFRRYATCRGRMAFKTKYPNCRHNFG